MITKIDDASLLESQSVDGIQFFKEGESSPSAYKILGKIYAYKRGGTIFAKPSDHSLMKMMREPAARLGADAVINFHSSIFNGKEYNSIRRWASGLAVKINTDEASPEEMQSDLFVVISPPSFAKEQSGKNETKFSKAMLDAAQYYLEQKGYYALIVKDTLSLFTYGPIDSMDAEALYRYGDPRAGLILFLSLGKVSSGHAVIAGGGDAQLSATLVVKKSRKVFWQNAAGGSTFSLGMINTLFQDRKKNAIYNAMKHVFESLPTRAEDYMIQKTDYPIQ